ncbi:unnamed protein product, partial [Prorocentrum cordatum]
PDVVAHESGERLLLAARRLRRGPASARAAGGRGEEEEEEEGGQPRQERRARLRLGGARGRTDGRQLPARRRGRKRRCPAASCTARPWRRRGWCWRGRSAPAGLPPKRASWAGSLVDTLPRREVLGNLQPLGAPRWAPGPSENSSGRTACPGAGVMVSAGKGALQATCASCRRSWERGGPGARSDTSAWGNSVWPKIKAPDPTPGPQGDRGAMAEIRGPALWRRRLLIQRQPRIPLHRAAPPEPCHEIFAVLARHDDVVPAVEGPHRDAQ